MRSSGLWLTVSALCLFALGGSAYAQLLTNGGFEAADCSGWTSEPGGAACEVDSTIFGPGSGPHTGDHYGSAQTGGPDAQAVYQSVTGDGDVNLTGVYAGGVLNPQSVRDVFVQLIDGDNAGSVIGEAKQTADMTAGFDWLPVDLSGTASSGTVTVRWGHTGGAWADATAAHVDSLELVIGGEPALQSAGSRRAHSAADTFDLNIPLDDFVIDPRQNGSAPAMVLTYDAAPSDPGCDGVTVVNGTCNGTSVSGNDLIIDMTYDLNACVEVTVGNDTVKVLTHEGNVNDDASVNVLDLQEVKNNIFQPVDGSTFINDVNCDGSINVLDLQTVKNNIFQSASCN
jgi:hypothetical protein